MPTALVFVSYVEATASTETSLMSSQMTSSTCYLLALGADGNHMQEDAQTESKESLRSGMTENPDTQSEQN